MAGFPEVATEANRNSMAFSDTDEAVLSKLTADVEDQDLHLLPTVQADTDGSDDVVEGITLTQAASKLVNSASKIASCALSTKLRTSTPKRKRRPDGYDGGGTSSSSDDRPDWVEEGSAKLKRLRKREIRTQRRKLLKDVSQLLSVMAKQEEDLSSSSDDHPDWIDCPSTRRRLPFKTATEKKLAKPFDTGKTNKAAGSVGYSKNSGDTSKFDCDFDKYLFLNSTPETVDAEGELDGIRETEKVSNTAVVCKETTLSEEEAIEKLLNCASLEDRRVRHGSGSSSKSSMQVEEQHIFQKTKPVKVIDETLSSGDEATQEFLNVGRIDELDTEEEGIDEDLSIVLNGPSQNTHEQIVIEEELSKDFDHDATLSEEEAMCQLLDSTEFTEEQHRNNDIMERKIRDSPSCHTSQYQQEFNTEFLKSNVNRFKEMDKADSASESTISPSILTNWGRNFTRNPLIIDNSDQQIPGDMRPLLEESEIANCQDRTLPVNLLSQINSSPSMLADSAEETNEYKGYLADEHILDETITPEIQYQGNDEEATHVLTQIDPPSPLADSGDEIRSNQVHPIDLQRCELQKNQETNPESSCCSQKMKEAVVDVDLSSSSSTDDDLRISNSRARRRETMIRVSPGKCSVPQSTPPLDYAGPRPNGAGPSKTTDEVWHAVSKGRLEREENAAEFQGNKNSHIVNKTSYDTEKRRSDGKKEPKSQLKLTQWLTNVKNVDNKQQFGTSMTDPCSIVEVELSSSEDEAKSSVRHSPKAAPLQDDVPLVEHVPASKVQKAAPEQRVEMQLPFWFGGVKVFFPCKPYKPQRAIMSTVAQSCRLGQFALLESPTGTGKTLALLCAALAWQTAEKAAISQRQAAEYEEIRRQTQLRWEEAANAAAAANYGAAVFRGGGVFDINLQNPQINQQGGVGPRFTLQVDAGDDNGKDEIPPWELEAQRILQQQQQNHEQQTPSRNMKCPKIFYGTRTHMQIKHVVSELRKTAYKNVRMCVLASREQFCINEAADNGLYSSKTDMCHQLLEEDPGSGCTYCDNVGIIKSHDNLSRLRCPTPMDIEDLVAIGRKKRACPYFASRSLIATADLVICPYNYLLEPAVRDSMQLNLKGEIVILDEAHNIEDITREAGSGSYEMLAIIKAKKDCFTCAKSKAQYRTLGEFFDCLLAWFMSQNLGDRDDAGKEKLILPAAKAIASLSLHKIDEERLVSVKNTMGDILEEIRQEREEKKERRKKYSQKKMVTFAPATRLLLESFIRVLQYVYGRNLMHLQDYDFVLTRDRHQRMPKSLNDVELRTGSLWQCKLNIWCHNSAVVFSELSSAVRSLLLSSGTLSPMHSFSSELGVSFPYALRGQHIVDSSQVFVKSVSKGPRGNLLSSEYRHARNLNYQDDLGELLLGICQMVPEGVLCFFSSYKFMELVTDRWKQTGLWDRIYELKTIFVEPRTSAELEPVITEYYECTKTGALMLAIMRGKISEGFDFADGRARAVVVVGIPYPSVKDPQVMLKQAYNNRHGHLQNGRQWYTTQAYRALNQALGRCIRHVGDWGAMILADHRFEKEKENTRISQWLLDHLTHYHSSTDLMRHLHSFIQQRLSPKS